jgi:hypothetical protein
MTREQLLRARLVELVDELLRRYEGRMLPTSATDPDTEVRLWGGHEVPAMNVGDTRTMNDLVEALLRVDAGIYGTCASCGNPIGFQWLQESPTTRTCESCASEESWRPSRAPG